MDRTETKKIMAILRAMYPNYYRDVSQADAKMAVGLWHAMLGDRPYEVVEAAVKCLVATSKWPPTVAEVNEEIARLTQPPPRTELEAWNLVTKAIGNSGYEARKEFERLPEDVRRVVGSPAVLHQWALMSVREVQTVVASSFQRSYRARAEAERRSAAVPGEVRRLLETAAKPLPGPGEGPGGGRDSGGGAGAGGEYGARGGSSPRRADEGRDFD